MHRAMAAAGVAVALVGCSATRPPRATVAQADLAVRKATESRASEYSPLEYQMAQDKLDRAQRAMEEEEYERARRLAEAALVDAELAEARAETAVARQAAGQVRRDIETLGHEAGRAAERVEERNRPRQAEEVVP